MNGLFAARRRARFFRALNGGCPVVQGVGKYYVDVSVMALCIIISLARDPSQVMPNVYKFPSYGTMATQNVFLSLVLAEFCAVYRHPHRGRGFMFFSSFLFG